jgi:uncharacterized membrane protein
LNPQGQRPELNEAISKVLRCGVVLSSLVLGAGLALMLLAPPPGAPVSLEETLAANFGRPTLSPSALVSGIVAANPISVLQLGMLILLATPFVRVAASVLLFLRERDLMYAGITMLVLVMLLLAVFVVGPLQG